MIIWALALLLVVGVTFYVAAVALPNLFLKLRYSATSSNDRCIKKVNEVNGQSMVFEPEEKWRKYIKQYVLAERSEKKQLKCKLDKSVSYIEFDIAVFNCQEQLETVIKVKDYANGSEYTQTVDLPEETSYVSINVLRVENEYFSDRLTAKIKGSKVFQYILLSALTVLMECILTKICLSKLFGGVFKESFIINLEGLLITLAIAGVLILINSFIVIITVKAREKKYTVKVNDNA